MAQQDKEETFFSDIKCSNRQGATKKKIVEIEQAIEKNRVMWYTETIKDKHNRNTGKI